MLAMVDMENELSIGQWPPYIQLGGHFLYRRNLIIAYLEYPKTNTARIQHNIANIVQPAFSRLNNISPR